MATTGSTDVGLATLVRAALPAVPLVNLLPGIRKSGAGDLDRLSFASPPVTITREHVAAYARVCGFPAKDTVPLTYPHILGFPMHLQAMADPAFPFPAIGGGPRDQHDHRPPRRSRIGETVEVDRRARRTSSRTRRAAPSTSSREVSRDGETVWEGRSTYLRRGPRFGRRRAAGPGLRRGAPVGRHLATARRPGPPVRRGVRRPQPDPPLPPHGQGARLQAPDRPRHVVGARCVAALENRLPDAVTVEVAFKKPIFLPGTVAFGSRRLDGPATDGGFEFSLTAPKSGAPHLQGRTTRSAEGTSYGGAHGSAPVGRRSGARMGPRPAPQVRRQHAEGLPHRRVRRPRQRRRGRRRPGPRARRPGAGRGGRGRGGRGGGQAHGAALPHRRAAGRPAARHRRGRERGDAHRPGGLLPGPAPARAGPADLSLDGRERRAGLAPTAD